MKFKKPENCQFDESTIPNMQALNYCFSQLKYKRNCIDAGGHIGTVSRILANKFDYVHAFEPVFAEYLRENTTDKNNITIYDVGLGYEKTSEKIYIHPTNSGGTSIVGKTRSGSKNFESKEIPIHKIDDYKFQKIDFIKIDVESYEWHVIKGGHHTIENQKPLLMIELMMRYEESKHSVTATHNFLVKNLGYRLVKMFDEDWVYAHPESVNEKAKRWPLAGR